MICRSLVYVVAVLSVATTAAHARQIPPPRRSAAPEKTTQQEVIDEMVAKGVQAVTDGVPGGRPFQTTFGSGREELVIGYLIAVDKDRAGYQALLQALLARADKQLGAGSSAAGSTTLASKGLVPEILGLAVESGAINRETSGTTVTLRVTPMGAVKALQGNGLLDIYRDYSRSAGARLAARVSVSASFDTSRGASTGTFTASGNQLSAWSVRAKLVDGRNPASPTYQDVWQNVLRDPASRPYADAVAAIDRALATWPAFVAWEEALTAATDARVDRPFAQDRDVAKAERAFRTLLEEGLPRLSALTHTPPEVVQALDAYVASLTMVQRGIEQVYAFVGHGPVATLDWTTTRAIGLPDLYTLTTVFETALGQARRTDFTVNATASGYRTRPAHAERSFKSFDLTGQVDRPLGKVRSASAIFTVAGRYSYMPHDTQAPAAALTSGSGDALAAAAMTAPKGHIGVLQLKLTIPVQGGIKIPFSITASNRTELIKEKDVRASFGMTVDLDSLIGIVTAAPAARDR
ncbi:MAG: hypothetical protein ABI051_13615 [Vicinamibacterales bacterium]